MYTHIDLNVCIISVLQTSLTWVNYIQVDKKEYHDSDRDRLTRDPMCSISFHATRNENVSFNRFQDHIFFSHLSVRLLAPPTPLPPLLTYSIKSRLLWCSLSLSRPSGEPPTPLPPLHFSHSTPPTPLPSPSNPPIPLSLGIILLLRKPKKGG